MEPVVGASVELHSLKEGLGNRGLSKDKYQDCMDTYDDLRKMLFLI